MMEKSVITGLKQKLAHSFMVKRLQKNRGSENITDFHQAISNVRSILIILPVRKKEHTVAEEFMGQLKKLFDTERIISADLSVFAPEQLTWLGLPRPEFIQEVQSEPCDLLIDLNSRQDETCCFISSQLSIPLKIHLAEGPFEHLYNLHFRTDQHAPLATRYDNLVNNLKLLHAGQSKSAQAG